MVEEIRVSAVVLRDERGRVLTVRKRGTARFMFPGGKPEPGESAADTAVREAREEVGVELDPRALRPLGSFRADAANEDGAIVLAEVFEHPPAAIGEPTGEIEELRWQPLLETYPDDVAPLLAHHVLPALPDAPLGPTSPAPRFEVMHNHQVVLVDLHPPPGAGLEVTQYLREVSDYLEPGDRGEGRGGEVIPEGPPV